ncbi:MAG TPA: GNAT family N-acetyltransferase, partial [Candidatus Limnocylindria bacterium]
PMPRDRHPGAAVIRRARPEEADALRDLAHRSKAHWPYDADFLAKVRPLLRLEPADVARDEVWVLQEPGAVAGWHRVTLHGPRAELEDLWLEPEWIRTGRGRLLFEHAAGVARRHGATSLTWDAEPYAEGFYRAMGGVEIGRTPSAVEEGRTLPRMRVDL